MLTRKHEDTVGLAPDLGLTVVAEMSRARPAVAA